MTYTVVERRQTWRIIEGRYWREAVVRVADGSLHLYLLRDEL